MSLRAIEESLPVQVRLHGRQAVSAEAEMLHPHSVPTAGALRRVQHDTTQRQFPVSEQTA